MPNSQNTHKPNHWVLGVTLLIMVSAIFVTLLSTFSLAQTNSEPTNANVNIDDAAPSISGALSWQEPDGEARTSFDHSVNGTGEVLTGIVGGNTNVIVNVNVSDPNGYLASNINVSARLVRSYSDGSTLVPGYYTYGFENSSYSNWDVYITPASGPVACSDVATISSTEHTWQCMAPIYFNSHPTTGPLSVTKDFTTEHWRMVIRARDDLQYTDDETTVRFEWPQIVGIQTFGNLYLGKTDTKGTIVPADGTPATTLSIGNKGNVTLDIGSEGVVSTNENAWSCTGGGSPLTTDLHLSGGSLWNTYNGDMSPLTYNGERAIFDKNLGPVSLHTGLTSTNFFFRFATTQPIGPGQCTLSYVLFTGLMYDAAP